MASAAQRVDKLTRAAAERVAEAEAVRLSMPSRLRPFARRRALRDYDALMARARLLTEQARAIPAPRR